MTELADTLKNALVHDPILKAGQDIAGGIADALAIRATKGPLLVYYDTDGEPTELAVGDFNTVSNDIYGDTLDVTDAKYLIVYVAFFLRFSAGPVVTTAANLAVNLESSGDGINWFPLGVINRAIAITPATVFRDDAGATAGALSTEGGIASAAMTQNAVLVEDNVLVFPAPTSAVAATVVVQRAYRFLVEFESYVRVAAMAHYDGPTDVLPPSLYMAVQKATG